MFSCRILLVEQTSDVLRPLNASTQNLTLVNVVIRSILPKSEQPLSAEELAEAVKTRLQTRQEDVWTSWTVRYFYASLFNLTRFV